MAKKTKSRMISVRLLSMAMTGFFYQYARPRTARPMSMLKYDPVGMSSHLRISIPSNQSARPLIPRSPSVPSALEQNYPKLVLAYFLTFHDPRIRNTLFYDAQMFADLNTES
ncbi:hypothetical protein FHL15_003631 [Xylaria flabelliformis]|uniref:Large ribosomal subunit protein bL33m n=1 Tax=Xylaria flabelliformis TaxID=2512241 RepID=A0A553I641_9PEZI|nr:hypothetical protein FHL15_003631 [Xylaria flabelliformis]